MIILGLILAVVGYLIGVSLLLWIGVAVLVVGLILLLVGSIGHPVGGRRWYY